MKKRISIAVSVVALALLLIAGTVAVTVAYLTSTATVENTFTIGKVEIALDEAKVDENGAIIDEDDRWADGNAYHLLPGKTYDKDPIVTVKAGSEACWLFVKVENGISGLVVADCIEDQMEGAGWEVLEAGVWYKKIDAKTTSDTEYPTFTTFTLKDDADVASLTFAQNATTADETIVVTAYAIQVEGLTDAATAWAALNANP